MALPGQIDAATIPDRPSAFSNRHHASTSLAGAGITYGHAEETEQQSAHRMVRRLANRHGCQGMCNRPEHARDAALMGEMLAALGLESDTPAPYTVAPESVAPVIVKRAAPRPAKPPTPRPAPVEQATASQPNTKRPRRPKKPRVRPKKKKCSWCKKIKAASEFNADGRAPNGLRSDCRDCHNSKRRARRLKEVPQ